MEPRKLRMLLFAFGAFLGGVLAFVFWKSFVHLGVWAIIGIFLAVWFAMGAVSILLLRRQNRRR